MPTRLIYFLSFAVITCLLLFSVYLQVFQGFEPCPLCTLQRVSFGLLGIIFMIGIFSTRRFSQTVINTLATMTSLLGIFLAGRQIWLQHFPSTSSNECGVSLQYMMKVLPLNEVLQKVLAGSAECTKIGWELLSLNMAEWALIWFVGFLCVSIYLFVKKTK